LETIRQKDVYYIDTDLPDVITTKKELIDLLKNDNLKPKGTLELLHLNALDEQQFQKVVNRFPSGKIAIVNEGLLMYLDMQEKEKLCKIIYNLLKERGGYWITADIYVKKQQEKLKLKINAKTQEFFEQHRIEDNKFESFEEARTFFKKMGFVVDQEAKLKRSQLSSMKYFIKSASLKQLLHINSSKVHVTWRLKIANG
jgi:O-methyltransferase involved in polyketide biosynthesis